MTTYKYSFTLVLTLIYLTLCGQEVEEDKGFCRINCDPNIHIENTLELYQILQSDTVDQLIDSYEVLRFPIKIIFVNDLNKVPKSFDETATKSIIDRLNHAYRDTKIEFYLEDVLALSSDLKIEDLSQNNFNIYEDFSQKNDKEDIISLYILDHKKDFCTKTEFSLSCSKIGGFSFILSGRTNNIVMSQFDLMDEKIVAHEFGHFFGLYHTFEEYLFGRDKFIAAECSTTGDQICDTPPDPGAVFEVYVNYSRCEMMEWKDELGNEYRPLIDNYMSYYKPCYLKDYSFTPQQNMLMTMASQLHLRKRLSR